MPVPVPPSGAGSDSSSSALGSSSTVSPAGSFEQQARVVSSPKQASSDSG